MRGAPLVRLLAVALVTTACSASPAPAPAPTVLGDGMITEVSSPGEGLERAEFLALGPQGEALIAYRTTSEDQQDLGGLALVYRDGSRDVIYEGTSESHPRVANAFVSETTVAWVDSSIEYEANTDFWFWDRGSRLLSRSSSATNEGDHIGLSAAPTTVSPTAALVGDTLFWLHMKGHVFWDFPDLVASYDDYDYSAIIASSSDGRTSLLLDPDDNWVDLGVDECASTPNRPVLWAVRVLDASAFESVQIDITDPHSATVIEGSGIPFSASGYYFHDHSSRCGNDLLIEAGDLDPEHRDHLGVISLESSDDISVLEVPELDFQVESVVLTPEWIAVTYGTFDFSAGAGGAPQPGQWGFAPPPLRDAPMPNLLTWLIHRDSGKVYAFDPVDYSERVYINGDFIAWEGPSKRGPYVGVLTPPSS